MVSKHTPKIVVVQGDTTHSAAFAYAANLNGTFVAHNEAGLRTFDKNNPYPEELNRKLISSVSDIHFAPTNLNKKNLINEGINKKKIFVVGNPGVDSFLSFLKRKNNQEAEKIINYATTKSKKIVFLTAHRREARGQNIDKWFQTLKIFFQNNKNFLLVCPEHPNKIAFNSIKKHLSKLQEAIKKGYESYILYLVQRENCNQFKIADNIDIEYKKTFLNVRKNGVKILCYNCKLNPQEIIINEAVKIL